MKGKLIVIEGLDGSGKATQAQKLYDTLRDMGKKVRKVSFPAYDSDSSALVKMYLRGDFGTSPDSVNPYAASSFYAVDRFASYKTDWQKDYESGATIIADRYTTSNAIHQCSKLPKENWDEFLKWLFDFEYNYLGIPAPDSVIYLRVDPDVSQQLMSKRYNSDESKKDIHERDTEYLRRSRTAADYCADTLNWMSIECTKNGNIKSIEEIFDEIMKAVAVL